MASDFPISVMALGVEGVPAYLRHRGEAELRRRPRFVHGDLTARSRAFMAAASFRHLALAYCCLIHPSILRAPAIKEITAAAPLWFWGILFGVIGFGLAVQTVVGWESHARMLMLGSVAVTLFWALALVWAGIRGELLGPFGVILLPTLAAKDAIIISGPLRYPVARIP